MFIYKLLRKTGKKRNAKWQTPRYVVVTRYTDILINLIALMLTGGLPPQPLSHPIHHLGYDKKSNATSQMA